MPSLAAFLQNEFPTHISVPIFSIKNQMPLFGLYYCELWGNKYEVHGKSGTVWETRDYLTAKDQGEDPYHCNRFGPLKQHLKSRDDEKTETGKEGMYDA
ncbi:MAG: hypothetical protein C7B47_10080 [Sulfobacillus thermosulfidooxidans]|uniref:Uncharacterized protein n=1 Tax=Sulfobacillus thermosulfidooxidans TaxID=28034 RepID=A0A2T2WWQ8_SULTH|nr:MAG: hypothetical protein C7B47_10080 [Sulfobacillus thermosulfidooxidans]